MHKIVGAASSLFLLTGLIFAAQDDVEGKTGLKVGAKAPSFTLKDQDGKDRSLGDLLAKGNVALVFHRSASW